MEHNIDKPPAKLDGACSLKKYIFLVVSTASLACNLSMVALHIIKCKTLAVGFFSLFNNDIFNTLWKLLHTCVHRRTYLHVLLNLILMAIMVKSGLLSSHRQSSSTGDDHEFLQQSQSLHAQKKAKEASNIEVSEASTILEQLISDANGVSKQKKETRDRPESHSLFIRQPCTEAKQKKETRDRPESHSRFIRQPCTEEASAAKIEKKISIVADYKQEEETRDTQEEIHSSFIKQAPCEEVSATTESKIKKKISISVADKPDGEDVVMGTESVGNIEKLSGEDFKRTVEAYIERQRRSWLMQRQNSLKRAVGGILERHRHPPLYN